MWTYVSLSNERAKRPLSQIQSRKNPARCRIIFCIFPGDEMKWGKTHFKRRENRRKNVLRRPCWAAICWRLSYRQCFLKNEESQALHPHFGARVQLRELNFMSASCQNPVCRQTYIFLLADEKHHVEQDEFGRLVFKIDMFSSSFFCGIDWFVCLSIELCCYFNVFRHPLLSHTPNSPHLHVFSLVHRRSHTGLVLISRQGMLRVCCVVVGLLAEGILTRLSCFWMPATQPPPSHATTRQHFAWTIRKVWEAGLKRVFVFIQCMFGILLNISQIVFLSKLVLFGGVMHALLLLDCAFSLFIAVFFL